MEEDGVAPCESPAAELVHIAHMNEFLKLPRAKRTTRSVNRIEPLVDYSQSQLLTSEEHISNLEIMVGKKERLLEEKKEKKIQREVERAKKVEEKKLKRIARATEQEAKRVAKQQNGVERVQLKLKGRGKERRSGTIPDSQALVKVAIGMAYLGDVGLPLYAPEMIMGNPSLFAP